MMGSALGKHGSLPFHYGLHWQEDPPAIVVRARTEAISDIVRCYPPRMYPDMLSSYQFKKIARFPDEGFGFDDTIQVRVEKDTHIFTAPIPKIESMTENMCGRCKGKRIEDQYDRRCFECHGTGHEIVMDWQKSYALAVSLSELFEFLNIPMYAESLSESAENQLMEIRMIFSRDGDYARNGIGCQLSVECARWIRDAFPSEGSEKLATPLTAMRKAYTSFFLPSSYMLFESRVSDGAPYFVCPGQCCCLGKSGSVRVDEEIMRGYGYCLDDHNVDTPAQSITFLAALAALHDQVEVGRTA